MKITLDYTKLCGNTQYHKYFKQVLGTDELAVKAVAKLASKLNDKIVAKLSKGVRHYNPAFDEEYGFITHYLDCARICVPSLSFKARQHLVYLYKPSSDPTTYKGSLRRDDRYLYKFVWAGELAAMIESSVAEVVDETRVSIDEPVVEAPVVEEKVKPTTLIEKLAAYIKRWFE